jgi:hypothetical protein
MCEEDELKVVEMTEGCKSSLKLDVNYLTSNELNTGKHHLTLFDIFN